MRRREHLTGTVIDRSTRTAAWIATGVTVPLVVVLAFVLGGTGGGTGSAASAGPSAPAGPTVVTSAVPDLDQATEAVCDPVLAAMPVRLDGGEGEPTLSAVRVTPGGPSILAWASPVVTLQCGVFRPADLRSDVQYQPILLGGLGKPQVAWLAEQQGDRVVWTTIDRSVYLAVTVPTGDTGYVQTVSDVIATRLPAVCTVPDPNKPDPTATYCGDRP